MRERSTEDGADDESRAERGGGERKRAWPLFFRRNVADVGRCDAEISPAEPLDDARHEKQREIARDGEEHVPGKRRDLRAEQRALAAGPVAEPAPEGRRDGRAERSRRDQRPGHRIGRSEALDDER